ncbi:MAG: hypothetical protein V3V08_21695 [Nannocystaceae bacterium]
MYQQHKDQGFIVLTLMDSGTAKAWVDAHPLTHPVVEVTTAVSGMYWSPLSSYPSIKTIKPGLVVEAEDMWPIDGSKIPDILP